MANRRKSIAQFAKFDGSDAYTEQQKSLKRYACIPKGYYPTCAISKRKVFHFKNVAVHFINGHFTYSCEPNGITLSNILKVDTFDFGGTL